MLGMDEHVSRLPGRPEMGRRTQGLGRRTGPEAGGGDMRLQASIRPVPPRLAKALPEEDGTPAHRPPPDSVAECLHAPLPDACLHCRWPLVETASTEQFQTDIACQPVIRAFTAHLGRFSNCDRRDQWRHPPTTRRRWADRSQIGSDAHTAVIVGRVTQAGLSFGSVAAVFPGVWEHPAPLSVCPDHRRAGTRLEPVHRGVLGPLRALSDSRLTRTAAGGRQNACLRVWVGVAATGYAITSQRSADTKIE